MLNTIRFNHQPQPFSLIEIQHVFAERQFAKYPLGILFRRRLYQVFVYFGECFRFRPVPIRVATVLDVTRRAQSSEIRFP